MRKAKLHKAHMISGTHQHMHIDGLPVFDAKKELILEVLPDDIKHSDPKDPGACAAAVAVMRQLGVTKVLVHLSKVYIRRKRYWERYDSPRRLRTEVVTLDRKGEFMPGEFKLNPICPSQQIETRRETYRLKVPSPSIALPRKSNWKKYPSKGKPGSRTRRAILANVRGRPAGFTR